MPPSVAMIRSSSSFVAAIRPASISSKTLGLMSARAASSAAVAMPAARRSARMLFGATSSPISAPPP